MLPRLTLCLPALWVAKIVWRPFPKSNCDEAPFQHQLVCECVSRLPTCSPSLLVHLDKATYTMPAPKALPRLTTSLVMLIPCRQPHNNTVLLQPIVLPRNCGFVIQLANNVLNAQHTLPAWT